MKYLLACLVCIGFPCLAQAQEYQPTIVLLADEDTPLAVNDAAPTPMAEVTRVIALLPKPKVAFVDFGCGYDARWCVAAAEKWNCKCIGVEINPSRAKAARDRIRNLGLAHLVTIVEGDVQNTQVSGDVAVAYLYPDTLTKLTPRLRKFKAFASYLHQPSGITCTKNGDTWFYQEPIQVQQTRPAAVWDGFTYSQPICTSPNCAMCNSIRRQLGYR